MKILAVDDNHFARLAFVYALKDTAYELETASSADEALAKVAACPFDMIFLDLKMPGKDGVEALRAIQPLCPQTPVYIITAYRDEFMKRLDEASASGLRFQVAEKPLEGERILAIVQGVLDGPRRG